VNSYQDEAHAAGFDYVRGSPHLKHENLRARIASCLTGEVERLQANLGRCRALEIGAGHGLFTSVLRGAGASVTVTEMSRASVVRLQDVYAADSKVTIVHDVDGSWPFMTDRRFDLVVTISVLHHIPDYMATVRRCIELTAPGGSLVTWQDPMWYPRMPTLHRWAGQGAYLLWRLGQGNYAKGARTRLRRLRGILDEREEADMVEYHVVRQGVDENALLDLVRPAFVETVLTTYWSTQAAFLHELGAAMGLSGTFGILARGRLGSADDDALQSSQPSLQHHP
jgi:SAM-dependent methyltransferase